MKIRTMFTVLALLAIAATAGEIKTLLGGVAGSDTISLADGESARLTYKLRTTGIGQSGDVTLRVTTPSGAVTISPDQGSPGPPEISGPASIKVLDDVTGGAIRYLATFDVTRVGSASPPACIPQEAGSTFNVILESSSDLVNWTPANPGSYPGLETKRFFRTRIVKQ